MRLTVFITGADYGLGLALAKGYVVQGHRVFAGKYQSNSPELTKLKEEYPDHLYIVELDITNEASVSNAVQALSGTTEQLDLLINNAAILGDISTTIRDSIDLADIRQVHEVNVIGTLRITNALTPMVMKSDTKLIVNISSEAGSIGECPREGWFAYCMSKAALNMQSALIHNELRKEGGQVLVVHPGHVQTFMRGSLDESGRLTPTEAAGHIISLIARHDNFKADRPAYVNYLGDPLSW